MKVVSTNLGNWEVDQIENGIRVIHKNIYTTGRPRIVVQLKPNTTYTYSQNELSGFSIIEDGGTIKYPSTGKSTVTTGDLGTLTIEYIVNSNSTKEFTNIQLEEGSTVTTYIPHKEQTFIFPLGSEKLMLGDYLADDGIHHVRGQVDLSTLTWASLGSNLYRSTAIDNIKIPETTSTVPNILAEKYKTRMQEGNFLNGEIAIMGAGNFAGDLLVCDETGTPSGLIQYELEEEIIVSYTSAQQKIYNEIKNAYSYDEMTIITGSSNGSKPFFIVQAYKDINKELNNKVDKVAGKELSTNDFTDEYKEQVDTNTEDIEDIQEEQTEQNTKIQKLQTENARLKEATLFDTTGQGQLITLDKTAELEFKKPPLPMGNSEQFTTTGKNLWINEIENGEKVENVTVTRNADGSLTFNGTATGIATFYFVKSHSTGKYLEENQTYTLSGTKNINTALSNACVIGGVGNSSTNDVRILTLSSTREITRTNSYIQFPSGTVLNNYTIKPFVELGTTQGEYEPYTNGASPNPDYPQPINNVTGDVEVVVQNKNLLDYTTVESTPNTTVQLIDNGFKATGKYAGKIVIENLKPNTNYYLQYIRENIIGSTASVVVFAGTSQSTTIVSMQNPSYFNTGENTTINIWFYASMGGADGETNFTNIQLEESTIATDYVEHKSQSFTFPLGNEKLMLGDYLADDGIHHVRGQVTESGTTITLNDAKSGGAYLCNKKTAGNLVGKTLTFDTEVTDVLIEYELEEEEITPYTSAQQTVYNAIKEAISYEEQTNISGSSNGSNPLFSVEAYQSTKLILENLENRLTLVEG